MPVIQTLDYPAPPARDVAKIRGCLIGEGIKLRAATRAGWSFRIAGVLPADEIGFVELGGGVVSVWFAASKEEAKHVAVLANTHNRQAVGTALNGAKIHGQGITAIAVHPPLRRPADVQPLYRCLESVSG